MATTYNGSAANGANPQTPSIVTPADADPLNVGSVNPGLTKLTDYIANIGAPGRARSMCVILMSWSTAQTGNLPGNDLQVALAPNNGYSTQCTIGADVTATASQNRLNAVNAGTYRVWFSGNIYNSGAGGQTMLSCMKNGSTALLPFQCYFGLMPTTTGAAEQIMGEFYITLVAADYLSASFVSHTGGSGAYNVAVQTQLSAAATWFGMERVA